MERDSGTAVLHAGAEGRERGAGLLRPGPALEIRLLRHAATAATRLGRYQGVTDEPLDAEGAEDACRRAGALEPVEALWSSPLLRCRQTAALLYPDRTPTLLDGLRELDFGHWEGHTWDEVGDPAVYDLWLAEDPSARFPGGETLGAFRRRTDAALNEIAEQCRKHGIKTAAVVTHGGVLMALLSGHARPHRGYFDWHCPPCGGYSARLDPVTLTLDRVEALLW